MWPEAHRHVHDFRAFLTVKTDIDGARQWEVYPKIAVNVTHWQGSLISFHVFLSRERARKLLPELGLALKKE